MPIAQQVRHCPSVEVGDDLIPTVLMPAWMKLASGAANQIDSAMVRSSVSPLMDCR
jgi:hypothetical protein